MVMLFQQKHDSFDTVMVQKKKKEVPVFCADPMCKAESTPDLFKDDWNAVAMGSNWDPGQFIEIDPQEEEKAVNLLQRSATNPKWFVWPVFGVNCEELKVSAPEDAVFFV